MLTALTRPRSCYVPETNALQSVAYLAQLHRDDKLTVLCIQGHLCVGGEESPI